MNVNILNALIIFNRNVISTWSSGTGAAGLFGAFTYTALIAIGITASKTMLLMLIVPLLQALAFFVLLRCPTRNCIPRSSNSSVASTASIVDDTTYYTSFDAPNPGHLLDNPHQPLLGFRNKIRYLPKLLQYILPLFFVYLCEYFINMGLVSAQKTSNSFTSINASHHFTVRINLHPRNMVGS